MAVTSPLRPPKRRSPLPAPRRLPSGSRKQLVIEASAPEEHWAELLRTIEDLARLGELIDCSLPPLECQYSSTPLRTATEVRSTRRASPVARRDRERDDARTDPA